MGQHPQKARAVVIGATGSIGAGCCQILVDKVGSLDLVARTENNLLRLATELKSHSNIPISIHTSAHEVVPNADIVIAVSSSTDILVIPMR